MTRPIALAVNYSPQARELCRCGRADFDWFKSPDWPHVVRDAQPHRPTYIHFDLMSGQGHLPAAIAPVRDALDSGGTRYVNTHVAPAASDLADLPRDQARARASREVRRDVAQLCDAFGAGKVIVENVPWESRDDYPIDAAAAEPEFVTELLESTGAMLLLDLAHARIASDELGVDARAFVAAHPTDRLCELHVTGIGHDDGRLRESLPMQGGDWDLFAWALDCIAAGDWPRPWVVALEYGGVGPHFEWRSNIDALENQLERCGAMMRERGLRD